MNSGKSYTMLMIRRRRLVVVLLVFSVNALVGCQVWIYWHGSSHKTRDSEPVIDARKKLARERRHFVAELEKFSNLDLMQEANHKRPLFSFTITPWKIKSGHVEAKNSATTYKGVSMAMVIFVKSHVDNTRRRNVARQTWASYEYINDMRLETIFIVGNASSQSMMGAKIQKESETYGDILQINITEAYKHVVYKTLAGMQWATSNFPSNWFYTSTDDDIMPDLLKIPEEIQKIIETETNLAQNSSKNERKDLSRSESSRNVLDLPVFCGFGYRVKTRPKRDEQSKWFVDEANYPIKRYPPYCFGGWYTMTVKLATELYSLSRRLPLLWIDDLWLTGFVRLKYFSSRVPKCNYCNVSNTTMGLWTEYAWDKTVVVTGEEKDLLKEWESIVNKLSTRY